jgi:hypothetical protein
VHARSCMRATACSQERTRVIIDLTDGMLPYDPHHAPVRGNLVDESCSQALINAAKHTCSSKSMDVQVVYVWPHMYEKTQCAITWTALRLILNILVLHPKVPFIRHGNLRGEKKTTMVTSGTADACSRSFRNKSMPRLSSSLSYLQTKLNFNIFADNRALGLQINPSTLPSHMLREPTH